MAVAELVFLAIFITGCGGGSESTSVKGCGSTPVAGTYQNQVYGFEFQYPKEVTVDKDGKYENDVEGQNIVVVISYEIPGIVPTHGSWYIEAFQNNAKMNLRDWFSATFDETANKGCIIDSGSLEKDSNGVITGAVYTTVNMDDACANSGHYNISPDRLTVIKWDTQRDSRYFDEIHSTFKFTNASATNNGLLSYSTTGVSATVSEATAPFGFTVDGLKTMADTDCGTQHGVGYFDELVAKFSGATRTVYNFKYQGISQGDGIYTVFILSNKANYASLDQFKKDFDICAAGGDAYPIMLNSDWLLFEDSCGSGFDDGSGRPSGCDEVRKIVEPSLGLD